MAGVVIEHKKGEVNELKASLRNPAIERDPEKKRDVVKRVIAVRSTCAQPPSLRPLRVCATVRVCVCVPGSAWICIGLFLPPSASVCLRLPVSAWASLCRGLACLCRSLTCVCLCLPISACLCLRPPVSARLCLSALRLSGACLVPAAVPACHVSAFDVSAPPWRFLRLARVRVRVFVCPCLCLCLWRAQQLRCARVPTLLYPPPPPVHDARH